MEDAGTKGQELRDERHQPRAFRLLLRKPIPKTRRNFHPPKDPEDGRRRGVRGAGEAPGAQRPDEEPLRPATPGPLSASPGGLPAGREPLAAMAPSSQALRGSPSPLPSFDTLEAFQPVPAFPGGRLPAGHRQRDQLDRAVRLPGVAGHGGVGASPPGQARHPSRDARAEDVEGRQPPHLPDHARPRAEVPAGRGAQAPLDEPRLAVEQEAEEVVPTVDVELGQRSILCGQVGDHGRHGQEPQRVISQLRVNEAV